MNGFFDLEFHEDKIRAYQPPLSKLDKIINWELFRNTIEKHASSVKFTCKKSLQSIQ